MFSCLQILEAFLWFVLITLLNVTLIILTLIVSRLLILLFCFVLFILFFYSLFFVFFCFFIITLLNFKLLILTLSLSILLNLLLRLVAFLLFLKPQCLASISRWITASSSWKRFCLFVCRALSSIMVICMLTAIRLLLTFVMSLYLLLRS